MCGLAQVLHVSDRRCRLGVLLRGVSLSFSLSLSLPLCLSLSMTLTLSLPVSVGLCLSLSVSVCRPAIVEKLYSRKRALALQRNLGVLFFVLSGLILSLSLSLSLSL